MSTALIETLICTSEYHEGERTIPATHFAVNANAKTGHYTWCRSCTNMRRRDQRAFQTTLARLKPQHALDGQKSDNPIGDCDVCQRKGPLVRYVYGERGLGAVDRSLCDDCDILLRVAHEDPRRLLRAAELLITLRDELRTMTVARLHRRAAIQ